MTNPTADRSLRFFTVPQIGERWQVSPRTVRRLISRQELVVHHIGAQIRVAADDLFAFEKLHRE